MREKRFWLIAVTAAICVVASTVAPQGFAFARLTQRNPAVGLIHYIYPSNNSWNPTISAESAVAPLESLHTVNMRSLPQEQYVPVRHRPGVIPLLVPFSPRAWAYLKMRARSNPAAPYNSEAIPDWYNPSPLTPRPTTAFNGLADSASTCPYFGGCVPPDQALAASSLFVVQGVNTSFAVYSPTGALKAGFPKNSVKFFGIPAPGACDPAGPFTSDPRAFYDPRDGRFWVAMLQVEGAFGVNNCPEKSIYWVAVSATSDPTGSWHVYAFNMRTAGSTNAADYTQIGLDSAAFYFGGNMFDISGNAFQYDEIFAASKAAMEAGAPVSAHGLKNIMIGGVLIDTLQPVLAEGLSPAAGLFINSFNFFFGGGACSIGCSGINVFAMANALTSPSLTFKTIASKSYTLPPNADESICTACIETLDTRISGTPVYRGGMITFALETGITDTSGTKPGILWGQVKPTLTGSKITGGTMVQNAYLSFSGDRAASFGTLMSDSSGNILMMFDSMSSTINPGIYYASRLATDPLGKLEAPVTLKKGVAPSSNGRWGDYEATSYDSTGLGNVWFSSQYSNSSGDWGTFIAKTAL